MNKPDLYTVHRKITNCDSVDIINKYFHLLREKGEEGCTVLDIGSGPGNVTHDLLLPFFKGPVLKMVGTDIKKEMVDNANAYYGNDILSFELFDIGATVPEQYVSYFDYVISFFTLQWIKDQRQLYANIHKVMKPNGQFVLSYIAQNTLYSTYLNVRSKPEYSPYIRDPEHGISPFQKSIDPKKDLQAIIEQAGFEVSMIEIEEAELNNSEGANLKDFLISIDTVYDNIPDHLKKGFMDDHLLELRSKPDANNSVGDYKMTRSIFVVYAKKR